MLLACVQTAGSVSMKRLNRLVKRTCASYAGWSAFLFYIALATKRRPPGSAGEAVEV